MRVILASASPRRRELLKQIFPEFDVIPSGGEEVVTETDPSRIVMELAAQKAESAAFGFKTSDPDLLIVGADTIVVQDGRILGKPADEADAFLMLRALSGQTHQVYTGVCLLRMFSGRKDRVTFWEKTDVTFCPMSEEEIRGYIATGDPMDKAGAYGIQSGCGRYISGIQGDYNNVVGLPVARLYHELKSRKKEWNLPN